MSIKARVLKTYKVAYGEGSFANRQDAVYQFLINRAKTLPNLILHKDDSVMELNPTDLQAVVDGLREGAYEKSDETQSPNKEIPLEELASTFESWLKDYDKSNSFVRVEWW